MCLGSGISPKMELIGALGSKPCKLDVIVSLITYIFFDKDKRRKEEKDKE